MPELPEVETVANELRLTILEKYISEIEALWSRSFQNEAEAELTGQKIEAVDRKGKYLILKLKTTFLVIHLRMTGQLLYYDYENDVEISQYIRVIIRFSDSSMLLFKDVRKFGRIYHVDRLERYLSHIGMDALNKKMTFDYFKTIIKKSKMSIKAFLMSQKYISGLGNIYTDEVLFLSGIHPSKSSNSLSKTKALKLFENIKFVLVHAIKNMGSTISDYRDPSGKKGKNQFYFKVYGRTDLPCVICATPIQKIRYAGRGTHFCPKCQKQ